jgi:hypothetical protein
MADLLGEPRYDRIKSHRGDDEFVPPHQLAELLHVALRNLIAAMLLTLPIPN